MKNSTIITVMKKELARFFGDKRMLLTTILLPGLMIYVMYTFMGSAFEGRFSGETSEAPIVYAVNMPASILPMFEAENIAVNSIDTAEAENVKQQITDQTADLCLVFPENFDEAVVAYQTPDGEAPQIQAYYNSAKIASNAAYKTAVGLFDAYETSLANKFDINRDEMQFDMASNEDMTGMAFSMIMPLLLMMFLYSGCMAVAPESIAGEKERGTIATMLITPAKRGDIAIGKIIALSIMALLSGLSSTLGTIISLPKLLGGASGAVSASMYGMQDYLVLGGVILSTVLLLVTLISIVSAFAKSVKEANTYIMPLMIVVMLIGISGMFGGGAQTNPILYAVPLYNSVQSIVSVFSFTVDSMNTVINVISNILYAGIGVFILTKMFNSERIMFSK